MTERSTTVHCAFHPNKMPFPINAMMKETTGMLEQHRYVQYQHVNDQFIIIILS